MGSKNEVENTTKQSIISDFYSSLDCLFKINLSRKTIFNTLASHVECLLSGVHGTDVESSA